MARFVAQEKIVTHELVADEAPHARARDVDEHGGRLGHRATRPRKVGRITRRELEERLFAHIARRHAHADDAAIVPCGTTGPQSLDGWRAQGPCDARRLAPLSLAELAALTAEEGCVGETLGALLAEEQVARAIDPVAKAILERIARDEARHAELAWRFVAWAVARGGEDVARAVRGAIARATKATLAMEIRPLRTDAKAWSARGIAEIVEPAAHALGARVAERTEEACVMQSS